MNLPDITLNSWMPTRNTLHGYVRAVGMIRSELMPKHKHWWHITLQAAATGLTTTPMPSENCSVEILVDHLRHEIVISTSKNDRIHVPIGKQSPSTVLEELLAVLSDLGIDICLDTGTLKDATHTEFDREAVTRYWRALSQIDLVFKTLKGRLREETGPVHVFPHHFDLSMNWFSGRLVPGIDPHDEENADEQMNFGFVSGDQGIQDAYFYITAYPNPPGWGEFDLPACTSWHRQGWTGVIMMYEDLRRQEMPGQMLLSFLESVQLSTRQLMGV